MLVQLGEVLLELHTHCREQSTETFCEWAISVVRKIIPCDAAFWGSGVFDGEEITVHTFWFDGVDPASMQVWEENKHLDVLATHMLERVNSVVKFDHAELSRSPLYSMVYHRNGIEQLLGTYNLNEVTGLIDAISLYRSDPQRTFSEEEQEIMQALVPHLLEARRLNILGSLVPQMASAEKPAACDIKGTLHCVSGGFSELVCNEWPQWRGPMVPRPVLALLPDERGRFVGDKIVIDFVPVDGDVGEGLLLLRGRGRSVIDDLTKREAEIAGYFSQGFSYKEVAHMLGISPATVKNHLSNIYLKLGVDNKATLTTVMRNQ